MRLRVLEPFYLVGGTALALQLGHRKSIDLDLYFLLDHFPLETMILAFQQKFKMHEVFHIVKSMTYFDDAEQSANPVVFDKSVTWNNVKASINEAVKRLS
jgi:hypothetical protein